MPKHDGTGRFIINLKSFNQFVRAEHFKLEDHRLVSRLMRKDSFMAKIDLLDAYYLIPIADEHLGEMTG